MIHRVIFYLEYTIDCTTIDIKYESIFEILFMHLFIDIFVKENLKSIVIAITLRQG